MTTDEKIQLIGQKIFALSAQLDKHKTELDSLRRELEFLRAQRNPGTVINPVTPSAQPSITPVPPVPPAQQQPEPVRQQPVRPPQPVQKQTVQPGSSFNLEQYIGGNLLAIIGISVLVIGLAIGVKYAIDRELISELTRIVLAYLAGGVLLALAFWLKKKFEGFSAVLLSGGMATLYFTTFAAYSFYGLFPQSAAFGLMVVFTAFTVLSATIYNKEIIGIFGLVGAYAVPILLDENSGRAHILFIYMSILNTGVLVLSFRKNWNILTHVAYSLSWIIFIGWFVSRYDAGKYQTTALVFSFLFFITFYISFIAYKTVKKEKFSFKDILLILLNSIIYFSIGFAIVSEIPYNQPGEGKYLGLFTLGNALVHLAFAYSVFVNMQVDRKLFYLIMALVLSFATIAIPVQLEGHWVTLFWAAEAFLLFAIGRIKHVRFYEWIAFAMVLLSVISLAHDWTNHYIDHRYYSDALLNWRPIANIIFFTSIFTISSIGGLIYIHNRYPLPEEDRKKYDFYSLFNYVLPILLVVLTYFAFANEIGNYFEARIAGTLLEIRETPDSYPTTFEDDDLRYFHRVWLINYTMFFVFVFGLVIKKVWRSPGMDVVSFICEVIAAFIFLTAGLSALSTLRMHYLESYNQIYFPVSGAHLFMRYICYGFLAFILYNMYTRRYWQENNNISMLIQPVMHLIILTVLSSELTHLMMVNNPDDAYRFGTISTKMGYTVLWGIYSFALITIGIMRKNKTLRVCAIALFAITLIKLISFDTWNLSTGYRIIAFITFGVILLVVAFLYLKFKTLIFGDDEPKR